MLEDKLTKITLQMSEPEIASSHEKLKEISTQHQKIESKIQNLYQEWEDLLE